MSKTSPLGFEHLRRTAASRFCAERELSLANLLNIWQRHSARQRYPGKTAVDSFARNSVFVHAYIIITTGSMQEPLSASAHEASRKRGISRMTDHDCRRRAISSLCASYSIVAQNVTRLASLGGGRLLDAAPPGLHERMTSANRCLTAPATRRRPCGAEKSPQDR